MNALAHRDWTRIEDAEVVAYADRLEVLSPGSLQNSMTVGKMLAVQRSPRNPLIVEVRRDYGYMDAGFGQDDGPNSMSAHDRLARSPPS